MFEIKGLTYAKLLTESFSKNSTTDDILNQSERQINGSQLGVARVNEAAILGRELSIAIPKGSKTAVQQAAMDAARLRAKAFDVDLKFTEF
jgi:hypothetical protein